jgi:SpoVK/Ycf46/Vps4 family AAA+-type ATPase
MSEGLLRSLRAAVEAAPDDVELRLHLAQMLEQSGDHSGAVKEAAYVLQRDPENVAARDLISAPSAASAPEGSSEIDATLRSLEAELADVVPPMFADEAPGTGAFDPERTQLSLEDVAGMAEVKARLEASFLTPLRNPELRRLYGKSLKGGLLLYGPPGCGKTFIARALAGEVGAPFLPISLNDVIDMYIGESERNIHEIFETARRAAPCVLFLDEIDALGQKRSQLRASAMRGAVNQLLTEMDGVQSNNEGVYVLAATNHPWDVDVALRRPGRFDRMVLVLPPDEDARDAVLRFHLRDRPIAGVEPRKIAKRTDGYSGADLAHICETAAERALLDSAQSGQPRMIEQRDLEAALKEVRPSIGAWLETARNVAQFSNESGAYDDLLTYLRQRKMA